MWSVLMALGATLSVMKLAEILYTLKVALLDTSA